MWTAGGGRATGGGRDPLRLRPQQREAALSSGIGPPYDPATGQGTVSRHSPYQTMAAVNVFYPERVRINPFMGAGALGTVLDDDNGDNFDHAGLGFVDGGYVAANSTGARPIEYHPGPPAREPAMVRYLAAITSLPIVAEGASPRAIIPILAWWSC